LLTGKLGIIKRIKKTGEPYGHLFIRTGIKRGSIRSDIDPKIWSVIYLAAARSIVQQWLADPKNIDLRMAGEEGMAAIKSHFKP
jgi:hypothetical protein